MQKIIFQFFLLIMLCSVTTIVQGSPAGYWGVKSNTVGVYAKSSSAVSLNGMDSGTSYSELKRVYGEPNGWQNNNNMCYWGKIYYSYENKPSHYLYHVSDGIKPPVLGIYGVTDIGIRTPDGVYLGMPYTEAQKIYGIKEDYGTKYFYVISPDHKKYMTVHRSSEQNSNSVYFVNDISIKSNPDQSIINTTNRNK